MSEAKHTASKWWLVKRDGVHVSIPTDKFSSIECYAGTPANARLIAASPRMLEALQRAEWALRNLLLDDSPSAQAERIAATEQVRAAIESATGA